MCGGVPVAYPIKKPVADNIIIVGDAAHHINPVTGGGITPAMKSGMLGGLIAADAVKQNDVSEKFLNQYVKAIDKDFTKRHKILYKIKEAISKLSDEDINGIAKKIDSIPIDKRSLQKVFMSSMIKKPSLVIDVLRVFTGI
jgi:digeranylgeranylglycerophospholipid reductase